MDNPPSWSKSSAVTGIFSASYLQSISKAFAVGAELVHQRPFPDSMETTVNYTMRWAPPASKLEPPPSFPADLPVPFLHVNPSDPTEIFTSSFSPSSGVLQSTYWRKINPRFELATELQLLMTPGSEKQMGRRGGLASVGFKLETIYATIRGMVDTHGKVATVLEEKIAPGLALTLSGEMDYGMGGGGMGKVGFGFTLEA
jgi:mitochondrial import receptor subunit TOM40